MSPEPVFVIVLPLIFKSPMLTVPVPLAVRLISALVEALVIFALSIVILSCEISLFVTNPSDVSVVFVALFVTKLKVLLLFAST